MKLHNSLMRFFSIFFSLLLFFSSSLVAFADIQENEILSVKKFGAEQQLKDGFKFDYTVTKSKVYDLIGKDETKFQKVEYDIDVISKTTNKRIGYAEVSFDLSYSTKNNTVNISNNDFSYDDEVIYLTTNMYGIDVLAGNKTDTASLSGYITINDYSIEFTITADKNGNTFLRIEKKIEIDDKSYDEYMEFQGFKKVDHMSYGGDAEETKKYNDLFSLVEQKELDNSNLNELIFNVKKYEVQPFLLKAINKDKTNVSDLNAKEVYFVFDIRNKKDNSYLATLRINSEIKYSPKEKYVALTSYGNHMGSTGDWLISVYKEFASGNGTEVSLQQHNILLKDKEKCYNFLLTVKCDKNGNVSISNPVSAL